MMMNLKYQIRGREKKIEQLINKSSGSLFKK